MVKAEREGAFRGCLIIGALKVGDSSRSSSSLKAEAALSARFLLNLGGTNVWDLGISPSRRNIPKMEVITNITKAIGGSAQAKADTKHWAQTRRDTIGDYVDGIAWRTSGKSVALS
jgi:hypothetical protein